MTLLVRMLGPDDWKVLRDVRLAALQDSPDAFYATYAESRERSEAEWRAWPRDGVGFCAFGDDQPVGMVGISVERGGMEADLFAMWVAPAARGTGAADALIRAALDWARSRGCRSVTLEVASGNGRAERVYARHGFVPSGAPTVTSCGLAMRLALT